MFYRLQFAIKGFCWARDTGKCCDLVILEFRSYEMMCCRKGCSYSQAMRIRISLGGKFWNMVVVFSIQVAHLSISRINGRTSLPEDSDISQIVFEEGKSHSEDASILLLSLSTLLSLHEDLVGFWWGKPLS